MTNDELMHYGVLGMKWGKRKARDKSSFNTNYRHTMTDKAGRIITTSEQGVTKHQQNKAKRASFREANAYKKAYGNKTRSKNELSVMGNKYDSEISKYKNRNTSNKKLISQTERYAAKQSTGKNIAKQFLLGSGGTTTYNMARSMGYSRGKSAARAILDLNAGNIAGVAAGTGVNAAAAKKNGSMNVMTKGQRLASQVAQRGVDYGVDYALRKSGRAGSLQQRRMMKEYRSRGH